jgi:alanine dehydrogenase
MLVTEGQNDRLKPGCLIVDISCDEGMGFSFAKPTNFETPIFKAGNVFYYAVDHSPSYLWNAATWEISNSLTSYLPIIMGGPEKWGESETIRRAIEIQDGIIQNPKITFFQKRSSEYPHRELSAAT